MVSKAVMQTIIAVLTMTSIIAVNTMPLSPIGPIFGLLSQPFWFWESWRNKQWGFFLTSIVVTISWCWGLAR